MPEEVKEEDEKCKCGENPAAEWHTCPYAEEICDNYTDLCNCCSSCTHECCMDI